MDAETITTSGTMTRSRQSIVIWGARSHKSVCLRAGLGLNASLTGSTFWRCRRALRREANGMGGFALNSIMPGKPNFLRHAAKLRASAREYSLNT